VENSYVYIAHIIYYNEIAAIVTFIKRLDGALPNGSITVLNTCRLNYPHGELNSIEGYAFRPVEAEEGKLKVIFNSVPQSSDKGSCKDAFC